MNKLHYTKSKHQLNVEKAIKRTVAFFLAGAICGAGATTLIHKCEAATIEPVPVKVESASITAPINPTPTPKAEYVLHSLGTFRTTAYCNCRKCCGKWAGGNTASGTKPTQGRTIAVDKRVIPLGTKVIIDGHEYTAEDTGRAIKGKRIDIYYNSHKEALNHGVQYKEVFIIKKG